MSLIDDATLISTRGFTPWEDSCHLTCTLCGEDGEGEDGPFPHAEGCAWRSMPRIIAALATAQRINFVQHAFVGDYGERNEYRCGACGGILEDGYMGARGHADDCAGVALKALLSGEVI